MHVHIYYGWCTCLTNSLVSFLQQGLLGCGTKTASALSAYGFGESLCASARTLDRDELSQYLVKWREDVRIFLRTDPINTLGSRRPALADSIPNTFPDVNIVYLYLCPLTSSGDEIMRLGFNQSLPDVSAITCLCELYFEWAVPATIFVKFNKGLFPAVVMSVLRQEVFERELAVIRGRLQKLAIEPSSNQMVCYRLLYLLSTYATANAMPFSCLRTSPLQMTSSWRPFSASARSLLCGGLCIVRCSVRCNTFKRLSSHHCVAYDRAPTATVQARESTASHPKTQSHPPHLRCGFQQTCCCH